MESCFGVDFEHVRLHVVPWLAQTDFSAVAGGGRIFCAPGSYSPDTATGRELIGHELTHLVQQLDGARAVPDGRSGLQIDPALEAEADRSGRRAARHAGRSAPITSRQV
jgi:hypothetical protein